MSSRIAIVTVCRNPGPLLERAVASVAALSDARVCHVVIDGASTDGTVEYLRQQGRRLFHWVSEPDRGIYDAMNKGWAAAPPDSWILFLGADDELLGVPSAAELRDAAHQGCRLLYGVTVVGNRPFRSRWNSGLRFRNTVQHQSLLVHKSVCEGAPFDTRYRVYGDWDFNLRLWLKGEKAAHRPSLVAHADSGGISASRPARETFDIARRNVGIPAALVALAILVYCGFRDATKQRAAVRA